MHSRLLCASAWHVLHSSVGVPVRQLACVFRLHCAHSISRRSVAAAVAVAVVSAAAAAPALGSSAPLRVVRLQLSSMSPRARRTFRTALSGQSAAEHVLGRGVLLGRASRGRRRHPLHVRHCRWPPPCALASSHLHRSTDSMVRAMYPLSPTPVMPMASRTSSPVAPRRPGASRLNVRAACFTLPFHPASHSSPSCSVCCPVSYWRTTRASASVLAQPSVTTPSSVMHAVCVLSTFWQTVHSLVVWLVALFGAPPHVT